MSSVNVSVIMATHNRASLLPISVDSILEQVYSDFELIIVNDASTDETSEVLKGLIRKDERIKVINLSNNGGPGNARNVGVEQAIGKYIAVMDDDDIALPHRLEVQSKFLDENPQVDLVFSSVNWINQNDEIFNIFPGIVSKGLFPKSNKEIFKLLYIESNKVPNPTTFFRSEVLKSFRYPTFTWVGEDWFLFMQIAASGLGIRAISEPLILVRRGSNHESLMSSGKKRSFKLQRKVLKMIRLWLKEKHNHEFDHLHSRAYSNQIVREARYWSGIKGVTLCCQALFLAPGNKYAWSSLIWLYRKAINKIGRFLGQ